MYKRKVMTDRFVDFLTFVIFFMTVMNCAPDLPNLDRRLDLPLPLALGDIVDVPKLDALVGAGAHKPALPVRAKVEGVNDLPRMCVDELDRAGGVPAVPQLDRVKVGGGDEVAVNSLPADLSSSVNGVECELWSRSVPPIPDIDAIVTTAESLCREYFLLQCYQDIHMNKY